MFRFVGLTSTDDVHDYMDIGGRVTQGAVTEDEQVSRETGQSGETGGHLCFEKLRLFLGFRTGFGVLKK